MAMRQPDRIEARVEVDLRAEGLLDGVHESARTAREALLRDLLDDGLTLEELRDAAAKDRIALLPGERLLQSDGRHVARYTAEQLAELAGVSAEDLRAASAALGVPVAPPGVPAHTELDLALARQVAAERAAGFSIETISDVDRTIARGVRKIAAASRAAAIETTLRPGMTEHQAAHASVSAAQLVATVTSRIALAFEAHLLQAIADDHIGATRISVGETADPRPVSTAFVDLVGFTQLGELLSPKELGRVVRRLERLAAGLVSPPTIVATTIGDVLMLVSADPRDLLHSTLGLVEQAAGLDDFPSARAGIAHGDAHHQGGEWYGETVNLASRITDAAPPGAVVATHAVRQQIPDGFRWKPFVAGQLKGVQRTPRLYRVTRRANRHTVPTRSDLKRVDDSAGDAGPLPRSSEHGVSTGGS
jgi:adenylate cyclase